LAGPAFWFWFIFKGKGVKGSEEMDSPGLGLIYPGGFFLWLRHNANQSAASEMPEMRGDFYDQ
jgi:hypothetical protein